jgi:hypothetical protein
MAVDRITLAQARASWSLRQWLVTPAPPEVSLTELVSAIAWIPLPSLACAPLALRARGALHDRARLDESMCAQSLVVSPGPRGTSWLVPAQEAPAARAFAVADLASREARVAAATTLTARDLDAVRTELRALLREPASCAELRAKLSPAALRPLGEVGRRNGLATVGTLVLKQLWALGEVRRVPPRHRADEPDSRWELDPGPRPTPSAADAVGIVAERWLRAFAPAPLKSFATALGIAAGRARIALEAIGAHAVRVDGISEECWVPRGFEPPSASALPARILPARDPLTDVHLEHLADGSVARAVTSRAHGVGPVALCDGVIVGGWHWDESARAVRLRMMAAGVTPAQVDALETEAARTGAFVARELASVPLHTLSAPRGATVEPTIAL